MTSDTIQAFGVGALEEEDEDIYATEKVTSYDFGGLSDHKEEKFGWTGPHSSGGSTQPLIDHISCIVQYVYMHCQSVYEKNVAITQSHNLYTSAMDNFCGYTVQLYTYILVNSSN